MIFKERKNEIAFYTWRYCRHHCTRLCCFVSYRGTLRLFQLPVLELAGAFILVIKGEDS